MDNSWRRTRALAVAISIAAASASLGGCGGGMDGVELNGKIFEALGVSGDGAFGKKVEPKTQARAPLVLPPDANRLPDPSAALIQTGALPDNAAWPKDREAQRISEVDAKKRAQDKYCKEDGNWRERATKDELAADAGPNGRCQGSIFSVITNSITGEK